MVQLSILYDSSLLHYPSELVDTHLLCDWIVVRARCVAHWYLVVNLEGWRAYQRDHNKIPPVGQKHTAGDAIWDTDRVLKVATPSPTVPSASVGWINPKRNLGR